MEEKKQNVSDPVDGGVVCEQTLLTPDEYMFYCRLLIENHDKFGHHADHAFEEVFDELLKKVIARARNA